MLSAYSLFETIRKWRSHIALLCLLFVIGCTPTNTKDEAQQAANPAPKSKPLPSTLINNSQVFEEDTLYSLIAAELALTREHYNLGLANYIEQAQNHRDVNIAARAAQVARILKRHPESLEMAELWKELNPGSREARFILVSEYLHSQRFDEAFEEGEALLEAGHSAGFEDIAIEAVDNNYPNLETLKQNFEKLISRYDSNTSLRVGLSVIYQHQKLLDKALVEADIATELDPDNVRVIYQRYRVLLEQDKKEAASKAYSRLVELQPKNFRVRSRYAHQLIRIDLVKAMEQYQILHEQRPNNNDVLLNLGLLQLDQKQFKEAEQSFTSLLERDKHLSISNFSLAEVYREKGDFDAALTHYLNVKEGSRYVDAISNAADILTQKEGFDNALLFISNRRESANQKDKEELHLVEGDALQRSGAINKALDAYSRGIQYFPDSVTLHYSRAMLYASRRETLLAEQDFKQVLEQAPDSAMVLNALGYTLLDQTDRRDEAATYIERAYELDPDDIAIIDSMGWLAFKRGDLKSALIYLRRAMNTLVDDEIAAHLGEVLWTAGRKKEARKTLQQGLDHRSESPHIQSVLKRLDIKL